MDQHIQPPLSPLPWLVFPKIDGSQVFYDVLQHRWEEKNVPWLHHSICMDVNSGWWLLHNLHTHVLSMFQPSTGQKLPLPDPEIEIDHDHFICRFSSSPPDYHIIAINRTEAFFFDCRPSQTGWGSKQQLHIPDTEYPELADVDIQDNDCPKIADALLYDGKIYALTGRYLVIIDVSYPTPDVSYVFYEEFCLPPHDLGPRSTHLVESDGELYKAVVYPYDGLYKSPPRTVVVHRMNVSSQQWEVANSYGSRVFMLGTYYSASLPAGSIDEDAANIKGGLIHFSSEGSIHSFNIYCRSLTTHFHGEDWADRVDNVQPYWLLLEKTKLEHVRSCKATVNRQEFDHPKYISYYPGRNCLARRELGIVTWSPKTPWLMLRQGYDSIIKFVDPCSNIAYELDLPELLDHQFRYSIDGWLVVSNWDSWWFFNPFTREKVDIGLETYGSDGLAVSSSPACGDCLVFSILEDDCGEGDIELLRLSDGSLTGLNYKSDLPFKLSSSSPVYHHGLFYCLGRYGNLGVYDPVANSWTVNDLLLPFDISTNRRRSYLLKSDSDLLVVITDEYEKPIGVYRLDSSNDRWEGVKSSLGDKTIFIGKEASFIVHAVEDRMANKIYSAKFRTEYNYDLLAREVSVANTISSGLLTSIDYISIWIEPKVVKFGVDHRSGRVMPPVIDSRHSLTTRRLVRDSLERIILDENV